MGTDVVWVAFGRPGQRGARRDGPVHRVLPSVMLREHDRQLDHLLELQLLRRHAVQDVAQSSPILVPRRRRQLDDGAGIHPRLHLTRQPRDGVVRLVHNHQRAVDVHQIGEGKFDPAALEPLQPWCRRGDRAEMRLHLLVMGVDLTPFGVRDP